MKYLLRHCFFLLGFLLFSNNLSLNELILKNVFMRLFSATILYSQLKNISNLTTWLFFKNVQLTFLWHCCVQKLHNIKCLFVNNFSEKTACMFYILVSAKVRHLKKYFRFILKMLNDFEKLILFTQTNYIVIIWQICFFHLCKVRVAYLKE